MKQLQDYIKAHKPTPKQTLTQQQKLAGYGTYRKLLGQNVALLYKEKRAEPKLVEIYEVYSDIVVFRYRAFYPTGQFRCYLYTCETMSSFICGDVRMVLIDE